MGAPQQMLLAEKAAAAGTTAVWDATAKNANVVLSGGNLTAADNGVTFVNLAGRGDTSVASGQKRYWEVTITSGPPGGMGVGIANSSKTWANDSYLGLETNSIGYFGDGNVWYNNASAATLATVAAGDVVCVALDAGNKIWWRKNGGNWNNSGTDNPATNTGGVTLAGGLTGTVYAGYNVRNEGTTGQLTANFGATAFAFTPPSGFTSF